MKIQWSPLALDQAEEALEFIAAQGRPGVVMSVNLPYDSRHAARSLRSRPYAGDGFGFRCIEHGDGYG